eukprot:jgi/Chlat1/2118/Chrsp17S02840
MQSVAAATAVGGGVRLDGRRTGQSSTAGSHTQGATTTPLQLHRRRRNTSSIATAALCSPQRKQALWSHHARPARLPTACCLHAASEVETKQASEASERHKHQEKEQNKHTSQHGRHRSPLSSHPSVPPLQGRTRELRFLTSLLSSPSAAAFLLVTGPPGAGKTALLKSGLVDIATAGNDSFKVARIDLKARDVAFDEGMAGALEEAIGVWTVGKVAQSTLKSAERKLPRVPQALKDFVAKLASTATNFLPPFFRGAAKYLNSMMPQPPPPTTNSVAETLNDYLRTIKQRPVLVIDNAHLLRLWPKESEKGLHTILRLLEKISVQDNAAHVIFASGDPYFYEWLRARVPALQYEVIGDLPYDDAKELFFTAAHRHEDIFVTDADWRAVYEACGTNPKALLTCLSLANAYQSLDQSLQHMLMQAEQQLASSLCPSEFSTEQWFASNESPSLGWTRQHCLQVYKAILNASETGFCVQERKLIENMGGEKRERAVRAMVACGLVYRRLGGSFLACDVPQEVNVGGSFITMAPMQLAALKKMQKARLIE